MANVATVARFKGPTWWMLFNGVAMAGWLYLASRIWPWPPYQHCDFAPGDPFYFFGIVVPLLALALIIQVVTMVVAVRSRPRASTILFAAILLTACAWIGAAAYDFHRGQRYVTEDCPLGK